MPVSSVPIHIDSLCMHLTGPQGVEDAQQERAQYEKRALPGEVEARDSLMLKRRGSARLEELMDSWLASMILTLFPPAFFGRSADRYFANFPSSAAGRWRSQGSCTCERTGEREDRVPRQLRLTRQAHLRPVYQRGWQCGDGPEDGPQGTD